MPKSDIIERLRHYASLRTVERDAVADEAANEIENLHTRLAGIEAMLVEQTTSIACASTRLSARLVCAISKTSVRGVKYSTGGRNRAHCDEGTAMSDIVERIMRDAANAIELLRVVLHQLMTVVKSGGGLEMGVLPAVGQFFFRQPDAMVYGRRAARYAHSSGRQYANGTAAHTAPNARPANRSDERLCARRGRRETS
jgi:hypothetical protein